MQNIFIDTSVFVSDNFLHGNGINGIFRLVRDGHFKLIMPLITINEIKSQFGKRAQEALSLHNRTLNTREIHVLKNAVGGEDKLTKFPKLDFLQKEFNDKLDKLISDVNTIVLPYPTINTTGLFDKYFNNKKPFGNADKKHEFPDAMALESLILWCEANQQPCIVIANDRDMSAAHKLLTLEQDHKKFLADALGEILLKERQQIVDFLFKNNKTEIETEVELWLRDKLDDDSLYYDHTNWMEVHDIEIPFVAISAVGYQITSFTDKIITAEVTIKAHVKIELLIDDESSMYKDLDDKSFHYGDTSQLEIEQHLEFPVAAVFNVVNKGDYGPDVEIVAFNPGREIELESDRDEFYR